MLTKKFPLGTVVGTVVDGTVVGGTVVDGVPEHIQQHVEHSLLPKTQLPVSYPLPVQ